MSFLNCYALSAVGQCGAGLYILQQRYVIKLINIGRAI